MRDYNGGTYDRGLRTMCEVFFNTEYIDLSSGEPR